MISIGKPEKGRELVAHLGLEKGEEYLFVDPDNNLYDAINLNRGVQRTFFNPSTPFSFLDRITKEDGFAELMEVLSKWNKGMPANHQYDGLFRSLCSLTAHSISCIYPTKTRTSLSPGWIVRLQWNPYSLRALRSLDCFPCIY